MFFKRLFLILSLCTITSCVFDYQKHPEEYHALNNWQKDNQLEAFNAFKKSCAKILENDDIFNRQYYFDINPSKWYNICESALNKNFNRNLTARHFFEKHFIPVKIGEQGLFTGYYTISLNGAWYKDEKYLYPIYSLPSNPESLNYTRKDINDGVLQNQGLEILYTDDPVNLYFLHVQGSGIINVSNGDVIQLSYAGKNNHPYTSIGKFMKENDIIDDDINAFSIKDYLRANPLEAFNIMNINQSYIFFTIDKSFEVKGAQNVPLTASRSLAVDPKYIPLGLPVWVSTSIPKQGVRNKFSRMLQNVSSIFKFNNKEKKYEHLFVAQDTGSAIKGLVRGDIYFGSNKEAEINANLLQSYGSYFLLVPK